VLTGAGGATAGPVDNRGSLIQTTAATTTKPTMTAPTMMATASGVGTRRPTGSAVRGAADDVTPTG